MYTIDLPILLLVDIWVLQISWSEQCMSLGRCVCSFL